MAAGRGAAHQEAQAPDLRQPAAAARAAAARRGAGDARLPVERAADLRLRPRHPARIPGAQRAARRSRARASRRPTTSSPAPGPRRCSPTRASSGPTRTSRCGRARCSSRIRRSGCRSSAARNRSSSPPGTICRSPRASAARGLRDDIIRYYAKCLAARRPPHHARPSVARHHRLCRRYQGAGGAGNGPAHPLFQPHPVQPRQLHRDRAAARDRLFDRRLDRLRAARKTCAPRHCCARISAT